MSHHDAQSRSEEISPLIEHLFPIWSSDHCEFYFDITNHLALNVVLPMFIIIVLGYKFKSYKFLQYTPEKVVFLQFRSITYDSEVTFIM